MKAVPQQSALGKIQGSAWLVLSSPCRAPHPEAFMQLGQGAQHFHGHTPAAAAAAWKPVFRPAQTPLTALSHRGWGALTAQDLQGQPRLPTCCRKGGIFGLCLPVLDHPLHLLAQLLCGRQVSSCTHAQSGSSCQTTTRTKLLMTAPQG